MQPRFTLIGLAAFLFVNVLGMQQAEAITVPGDYPTIQSAITAVLSGAAPNGSVIDVAPGTYREALVVNSVSRSVTVRGVGGSGSTIVDAGGMGVSALRIYRATGTVRFEGLWFRGGTGGPGTGGGFTIEDASPLLTDVVFDSNTGHNAGGGVLTRSNAQFTGCRISNNSASQFGGGMVISTGSRPTFTNCQIVNNSSGLGGAGVGSIGSGGGVHTNDASPTFRGCLISGNRSKFGGGGIFHMGLFNSAYGPALLLLEDTEVSNNVSSRFSNADLPAEGGGVHVEDNAVASLIRARIVGNSANTGGGLNGYRSRYEISSSVIEGNHAPDPLNVGGFGGGISMTSNNTSSTIRQASSLLLVDSVVRNNDALKMGGIFITGDQTCGSPTPQCSNPATATRASMQIDSSLIDGNIATIWAGGMRLDRTDATISNSHILRNTVAANNESYGGGLLLGRGSNVTISDTTIAKNSAVRYGGGIFIDDAAVLNLTNSRLYANTAGLGGGGMYVGGGGPNTLGPPTGTVQGTVIADNIGYQMHEQACSPLSRTILNYRNNVITPRVGQSDLYFSTCGGATTTISAFNALSPSRTSGNTSAVPSFTTFHATPDVGPTFLSWTVARASSVNISGVTFSGDVGATPAAPTAFTTYTLGGISRSVTVGRSWGGPKDTPVSGDFDGDGRKDLAMFRGATGQWFILRSNLGYQSYSWGSSGDIPVPADYDGDGWTDIAIFRPATAQWFIMRSSAGPLTVSWGASGGDAPIVGDFDGDGKADLGVYRSSSGQWIIRKSTGGTTTVNWGGAGDIPVPADYDGDDRADIAVYRPSTGQWFLSHSSGGMAISNWGGPSLDTPVPADYDGDGRTDLAVARRVTGQWFIRRSLGGSTVSSFGFGDDRLPGDYDGVGRAEMAIWRASSGSWLIQR